MDCFCSPESWSTVFFHFSVNLSMWRLIALLSLVWGLGLAGVAGASTESAVKPAVRYDTSQFTPRFLYPGGEVVLNVDWLSRPDERIMALTFDDGPDERDLEIMTVLEKYGGVPAAFFYIGSKVKGLPEVVKKVHAQHHEIGYHSYRHQRLRWFSHSTLGEDFRQGKEALAALGVPLSLFRPPYGDFTDPMVRQAKEHGMETILWTIDSRDWTGVGAEAMARNVIRHFHPGAVLLFHSQHAVTLRALPMILEAAERENYRFVTLKDWRKVVLAATCRGKGEGGCSATATVTARIPTKPAGKKESAPVKSPSAKGGRSVEREPPPAASPQEVVEAEESEEEVATNPDEEGEPMVSQVIDPVIPALQPISIVSE